MARPAMAGWVGWAGWRAKALAHAEMVRPYTMFHPGLLAVAGAELASAGAALSWRVALAGIVTICGWEAGLYAGDFYDREIDARSKPSRPVPSGRVSAREAFLTMVGLILAGYAAALALGVANLVLAVVTTVLGISYSKTFKSNALLGNFDRGVLGACAVFFGALAGGAPLRPSVLLLAGLAFFHDSASNLVGAARDVDGDRAAGCHTVPVVYGMPAAIGIAAGLALAAAGAGCWLMIMLQPNPMSVALFVVAVAVAGSVYLPLWAARRSVSRARAFAAHKWLVCERLILVSAFIAAYAPAAALILLGTTLAVTIWTQALLRDRYERQQIAAPVPAGAPAVAGGVGGYSGTR